MKWATFLDRIDTNTLLKKVANIKAYNRKLQLKGDVVEVALSFYISQFSLTPNSVVINKMENIKIASELCEIDYLYFLLHFGIKNTTGVIFGDLNTLKN